MSEYLGKKSKKKTYEDKQFDFFKIIYFFSLFIFLIFRENLLQLEKGLFID